MNRREFLKSTAALAAAGTGLSLTGTASAKRAVLAPPAPLFKISLAQWSLNTVFFGKQADPLDFPVIAKKDYGIEAVEYVNQFFMDKAKNTEWLTELKKRGDDAGVKHLLIMCDREGNLGDPDDAKRAKAVENHFKWAEAAKFLGCHSIRVNAATGNKGTDDEQAARAADGLSKLTEFAAKLEINVLVENHGGLSSNGAWLAGVMKKVNHPRCGTLPDFGNFNIGGGKTYDRYQGVTELMPFAKAVSAKSHDFDDKGEEVHTDYHKMMKIVLDAGYRGWVGIEYEGKKLSKPDGIKATKALLEKVRAEMTAAK